MAHGQCRMDTGIIGPITDMDQFAATMGVLSSSVHGITVSCILISAAISSFFAGHIADRIGRVKGVALGTFIFGVGNALEAGAVNLAMLIVGRLITGVGEGFFLSGLVV